MSQFSYSVQDHTGGHLKNRLGAGNWIVSNSATYEGSILAAPCLLISLIASNEGSSSGWLMLFDSLTAPSNGTAPSVCIPINVPGNKIVSFNVAPGLVFNLGVYWVISSTQPTLTAATGATFNVMVATVDS